MSTTRKLVLLVVAAAIVTALVFFFSDFESKDTGAAAPAHPSATTATVTTTAPTPSAAVDLPANPDSDAAEDTVRQALSVAFTWYPATDRSPTDAYVRARSWYTKSLAATLLVDVHTERGPGAQWRQWASDNAKVVADVSVGCSGCPEDTDTTINRVATIKQTAIVGASTTTVKPDTTVWVTLAREGDRWLIDDIRY